jgi:5'-3' exonuclease
MILLDYSQIALSNIIVQKLNDESMIRHMILNSIRMYNKRYREEYGQMVICADGMNTWRKDYFPYYKAKRRKNRDSSDQDWNEIFRILHLVRDEIKENLPYKVVHMEGVEADDIIASLVLQSQEFGMGEPMMIVSSDKDFIQLQKFNNVKQFSPIQKKMVKDDNPRTYLFNHIMKGDSGDGIPNVLSDDDTFVSDKTQSPLRKTRIAEWLENSDNLRNVMEETIYRNYQRNKKLIDLTEVPKSIQEAIINNYNDQKVAMKMRVLNYLIKKRCNQLIEVVEEFYNNEKIIA